MKYLPTAFQVSLPIWPVQKNTSLLEKNSVLSQKTQIAAAVPDVVSLLEQITIIHDTQCVIINVVKA